MATIQTDRGEDKPCLFRSPCSLNLLGVLLKCYRIILINVRHVTRFLLSAFTKVDRILNSRLTDNATVRQRRSVKGLAMDF